MKPRWRPGKKADTTCPQWILDGVKRVHQQATNRTEQPPQTAPLSKDNMKGLQVLASLAALPDMEKVNYEKN